MATLDGDAIQALVWNYHDDIVPVAATRVRLAIKVPASFGQSARVSHLRVDESHGDAYTVWVSQGMPASPSAAQFAALEAAMDPSALVPDRTVAVAADGSVCTDFDLPRFGVSLVTIVPAAGASDGGTDTDGCRGSPGLGTGNGSANGSCAYRVSRRGDDAANSAALLAMSALVIVRRRRRGRGTADARADERRPRHAGLTSRLRHVRARSCALLEISAVAALASSGV